MRSNPYQGLDARVAAVVRRLLTGADAYNLGHEARLARTVDILTQLRPRGRALELGTNDLIPLAAKELFPAVTIDVTVFDDVEVVARKEKKLLELAGQKLEVDAFALDLEFCTLPVDDETYDMVICCEVIEHMEIDPMFMLSEVNRVLKTNGRLLMTTPNATSSHSIAKVVRGIEPYFYMQYNKNRDYHRHNYEYSVPTLTAVLKAAGFCGKIWTEDLFEDPLNEDVEKLRSLGYELTNIGDNIIVVATKTGEVTDRHPECIYA